MRDKEYKQDDPIRIPKQKLGFYKRIKVDKDIRILIKVINYFQKMSQTDHPNKIK